MQEQKLDAMDKIISLAKRRGFIFPGSDIYGGLANAWDYGPLGVELKNNVKQRWWKTFVTRRADMVGLDAALLMNTKVWQASGHLKEFSDPLVECKACHARFRADQIDIKSPCPDCKKGELTAPKQFNLMLKTFLGPVESEDNVVYFRPETAQGIFVNFKNIADTMRMKLPFGIAQIGKAFRNEITPGNYIFRTREFEQMEIEYFIRPPKDEAEWQTAFEDWRLAILAWCSDLGLKTEEVHELEVAKDELAHYSKRTIDFEYDFPFGRKELFGLAYRTDFDLNNHSLNYTDDNGDKLVPHCIEPSLGVDRSILAALLSAYSEEEIKEGDIRTVLKLPKWLAPIKAGVFPLMKNKPELVAKAKEVFALLSADYTMQYDDNGNVGKRYRRQDEIGTPYCLTIDFDTLGDNTVTVRDRDTMEQQRVLIAELPNFLRTNIK
ncbi:glycine--tRNA ligase [Candidatus Falkowbacteria bacterium CG10_big_fil_rev_8_21_14_0_10_37_14]|uniref:Glycine--tRNA ligase n=1 Tax=Candidatus Falkowbacteria bacterium CG10_big_fil_rev_8_21_14_0_10_37_14 TaxID=1974561 RepID=A0A2M6WUJ4_9BACT|nr:glycine--tRNA ligase [Candidatus Falkowbacteria bacterium]PIT96464.1 MAG: glycine--tRNA ligase [Candidatus Falkowbacteria bacterium CG10_big_fil_rev_8_21_14_0_10_37_14]